MSELLKLDCYRAAGNMREARELYEWLTESGPKPEAPPAQFAVTQLGPNEVYHGEFGDEQSADEADKPLEPEQMVVDAAEFGGEAEPYKAEDFDTITIAEDPSLTQDVIDALVEEGDAPFDFMQMDRVVKWEGGECPVDPRTLVGVMTRDGKVEQFHAGTFSNPDPLFDQWKHSGFRSEQDIVAYRVTFPAPAESEGETHTDGVRNDSQQDEGAGERADPQTESITNDPELQAAVARAEATLAAETPAYVGLQDADLDAEYEAMKAREAAEKAEAKPRSFWEALGVRKLEEVK